MSKKQRTKVFSASGASSEEYAFIRPWQAGKLKAEPYFHSSRERPGHGIDLEEVERIRQSPDEVWTDPSDETGRTLLFFGKNPDDDWIRVVLRTDASAIAVTSPMCPDIFIWEKPVTRAVNSFQDRDFKLAKHQRHTLKRT